MKLCNYILMKTNKKMNKLNSKPVPSKVVYNLENLFGDDPFPEFLKTKKNNTFDKTMEKVSKRGERINKQ